VTVVGVAAGLAGAFALRRLVASMLFGVGAGDPATLTTVALLLGLVALAAGYVPARRASRVDPSVALRAE
jgi:putative ABC transport system permease protein